MNIRVHSLEAMVQMFLEGLRDGAVTARYQDAEGGDWLLAYSTHQTLVYCNGQRVAYRVYQLKDEMRFSLNRCAALTRWFAAMQVPVKVKWVAEEAAFCVTNPLCTRVFTGEMSRQLLQYSVDLSWLMGTTKELPE